MSRIRLTRQDNREQTRQHLLEAAATVIAHHGFATTTVEGIVEHAGYTRGAFYSNFNNKLELFTELINTNHADIKNSLHHLLDASFRNRQMKHASTSSSDKCDQTDRSLILWIEARQHAMRDMAFRHTFNELTLELRNIIACSIDDYCRRMHVRPSITSNALALAMMTLIDGSLCFRINMPTEMSAESLRAMLHSFFVMSVFGTETPCPPHCATTADCATAKS